MTVIRHPEHDIGEESQMSIRERFVIDVDDKIRFRDWDLESETLFICQLYIINYKRKEQSRDFLFLPRGDGSSQTLGCDIEFQNIHSVKPFMKNSFSFIVEINQML